MHPIDLTAEEFDPQNLTHWLLVLAFIGMAIYGFWTVGKVDNSSTHRYNRNTGKVEPIEHED